MIYASFSLCGEFTEEQEAAVRCLVEGQNKIWISRFCLKRHLSFYWNLMGEELILPQETGTAKVRV